MSKLAKALTAAAGNAGESLYVEDVFSTYLYTGTGATQTITNGIDLDGEGGLVWIKERSDTGQHHLYDTERGATKRIHSNSTAAEATQSDALTAFNSDGFTLGGNSQVNDSGEDTCSWTFRKAEKFFDVVTYSGDGVEGRVLNHSLGATPKFIIIKATTASSDWVCHHSSLGFNKVLYLNKTDSADTGSRIQATTDTTFTVSSSSLTNSSARSYVAYLFASDAGGFGDDDENIIKCGSYTGNGGTQEINVGFEPQWLLVKKSTGAARWFLVDSMRGFFKPPAILEANSSAAEQPNVTDGFSPTATGFKVEEGWGEINASGETYIYIAIRRPMKTPESGTEVFAIDDAANGLTSGFPVDWFFRRTLSSSSNYAHTRLCGETFLTTDSTDAEQASSPQFDNNTGVYATLNNSAIYGWMFKRATGFFDVVAFDGGGAGDVVDHNLGVKPDLLIYKRRSAANDWIVYNSVDGADYAMFLNKTDAREDNAQWWNDVEPTATNFTTGSKAFSGSTYIAYLFATLDGVSKVGSYTGTGSNVDVDCGFSAGARFILIKRTDSTGDWYVYDYFRGIVSGNDPYLLLNTGTGEVTSTDYIDPLSSGFTVTSSAPAALNASGGNYIFLAIA